MWWVVKCLVPPLHCKLLEEVNTVLFIQFSKHLIRFCLYARFWTRCYKGHIDE